MVKRNKGDQVSMEFKALSVVDYTDGAGMTVVIPPASYSESFTQVNDLYRYFRMDKLVVKAWVYASGATAPQFAMFWVPNGTTNAISNIDGLDSLHMTCGVCWQNNSSANGGMAGQVATLSVPKGALAPPGGDWYVTQSDASDGFFDFAGNVTIQMATTTLDGKVIFEVSWTSTFKERLDPVNISMALEDKVEREVRRRLATLAVTDAQSEASLRGGQRKVVTKPKSYYQTLPAETPSKE